MSSTMFDLFLTSFGETLFMTVASAALGALPGGLLGLCLHLAQRRIIAPGPAIRLLELAASGLRSTPSIIVLAASIPLTRLLAGDPAGLGATIVPLAIIAAAFVARHVQAAMDEVDRHVVEAAMTMGASHGQIILRVLLPEASAGLAAGAGVTLAVLVGYSALAGAMGGGGLGDLGIRHGYANFLPGLMLGAALALIALAETFHVLGNLLAQRLNRR